MEDLIEDWMSDEEKEAIRQAAILLKGTMFEVKKRKTLEDIHPADREYSSPYYDRYGDKVTANGIAWEERMCDGDYIHTVRFGSSQDEWGPEDYDDRDYSDYYESRAERFGE